MKKTVTVTPIVDGVEGDAVVDAQVVVPITKLNALPSTGGIGTTIFSIGVCVIMIAAAYMFFASRRRDEQ